MARLQARLLTAVRGAVAALVRLGRGGEQGGREEDQEEGGAARHLWLDGWGWGGFECCKQAALRVRPSIAINAALGASRAPLIQAPSGSDGVRRAVCRGRALRLSAGLSCRFRGPAGSALQTRICRRSWLHGKPPRGVRDVRASRHGAARASPGEPQAPIAVSSITIASSQIVTAAIELSRAAPDPDPTASQLLPPLPSLPLPSLALPRS